jgi:myosin-5
MSISLFILTSLSRAALLHSVKVRYQKEVIYTYSGLVLIAMNPFRYMNIYTPEIMRQYAGRPRSELEPHLVQKKCFLNFDSLLLLKVLIVK